MDRADEDATISTETQLFLDTTLVPPATSIDTRRNTAEMEDAKAERRLKDAVRRYYALAELIETERGYVDDLKILVEIYLTSLGAITGASLGPRAGEVASTSDVSEGARFGTMRSSTMRSESDPPSFRPQSHSYQYPPSSFPSSAAIFKEHAEPKPKTRARPASLQMLFQPQHVMRIRRDSGPDPYSMKTARKSVDDLNRSCSIIHENEVASGSKLGAHSRTRSAAMGFGSSSGFSRPGAGVRRASADVVETHSKPIYDHAMTSSPESSPHPSPLMSPSPLPSIPSTPISSQPVSPLPASSHISQKYQRLRAGLTDADRRALCRDAHEMLVLHERIVRRIENALVVAQRREVERRRTMKGKEKAGKEQAEIECEVEAAVRAVCGVFIMEAQNFTPYEAFCAGHTEALETVRRIMRSHANEWVEWEKRCAEAAVWRDIDGAECSDIGTGTSSPLLSPSPSKTIIAPSGSRSSLLSTVLDTDDADSSTSTPRRRHSACASPGSLRTSTSATLKHTKSDPTPPAAGYGYSHAHMVAQGQGLGNAYCSLSVKSLSRRSDGQNSARSPMGTQNDKERQRERSGRTKLAFADYLIKPVQRLCKYPLLFQQLRAPGKREETDSEPPLSAASTLETGKFFAAATASVSAKHASTLDSDETPTKRKKQAAFSLGGDSDEEDDELVDIGHGGEGKATDVAIEQVLRKMREVAHAVDEAQRRHDLEKKSALIVERLVAGAPSSNHGSRLASVPDVNLTDDEKDHAEDGQFQSRSEVGHGTVSTSGSAEWSTKPPARSLSFSSAFSRSRSRNSFLRTNSAYIQQSTMSDEKRSRLQVPGPPTRAFLASLGACLLAGSLDVVVANIEQCPSKSAFREETRRDSMLSLAGMSAIRSSNGLASSSSYMQQPSREPVKVKYLAAFLYVGGYVVLAKTPKTGVYEPRHWFALTDETIEVVDVREEKALLPCSFHLVFHATGHRLELAAACQREKEIWLNAMNHARSLPPMWEFEPVPTLNISANLVNTQMGRNGVDVPPVPSMPVIGDDVLPHDINPSRMSSCATLRTETTIKPNRRQSVNGSSMRAFFMNSSDNTPVAPPTVIIRRVSASRRAQMDRYLVDVLSQPLMAARFHAKAHDEVLFRDPDPPQQGMGIGVGAMAKNKLMGRESVLISKQYSPSICSSLASSIDHRSMVSESASSITVQQQFQSSTRGKTSKNLSRSSLSMLLTLPGAISDANLKDSRASTPSSPQGAFSPNSPLPSTSTTNSIDPFSRSQCSSSSTSAPSPSPVNELFPPEVRVVGVDSLTQTEGEELPEVLEHEHMDGRPKRSRSLVSNFRGFFGTPRSLSSSPAPSLSSSRQTSVDGSLEVPNVESTPQKGVLSRMMRSASFRPRGSSAPTPTSASSSDTPTSRLAPVRPSFISRSASMLAIPRRKTEPPARTLSRSIATSPPVKMATPPARLSTRTSRSSLVSEARSHMSLGRSIKYRLFPGNLVPLTPIECSPDRMS